MGGDYGQAASSTGSSEGFGEGDSLQACSIAIKSTGVVNSTDGAPWESPERGEVYVSSILDYEKRKGVKFQDILLTSHIEHYSQLWNLILIPW